MTIRHYKSILTLYTTILREINFYKQVLATSSEKEIVLLEDKKREVKLLLDKAGLPTDISYPEWFIFPPRKMMPFGSRYYHYVLNAQYNYTEHNPIFFDKIIHENHCKVSIIIPVYNTGKYLSELVNSIFSQSLRDYEIIFIDDGSTDNSLEIMKQYERKDKRVIVLSQMNQGQSVARNIGLKNASGEYIFFVDSDDLISKNCLEKLYNICKLNNLDICYFNATAFFESEDIREKNKSYEKYYLRKGTYSGIYTGLGMLSQMDKFDDYRTAVWGQFYKKSFLIEYQISFYNGIIHEDNLFSLLCSVYARKVMHIPETYYYRRVRSNSTMTKNKSMRNVVGYFICYVIMCEKCLEYEIKNNALQKQLDILLNSARRIYKDIDEHEKKYIPFKSNEVNYHLFNNLIVNEYLYNNQIIKNQLIINSRSYKLAQMIAFFPRKMKGGIKCYREHGFKYTVRRLCEKIGLFKERRN